MGGGVWRHGPASVPALALATQTRRTVNSDVLRRPMFHVDVGNVEGPGVRHGPARRLRGTRRKGAAPPAGPVVWAAAQVHGLRGIRQPDRPTAVWGHAVVVRRWHEPRSSGPKTPRYHDGPQRFGLARAACGRRPRQ